jgi:hypothetical protein
MAKCIWQKYLPVTAINNPNVWSRCGFVSMQSNIVCPANHPPLACPPLFKVISTQRIVSPITLPARFISQLNHLRNQGQIQSLEFGPASGPNNTSSQNNPVHNFSAPGTYNVLLVKFTNCGSDTLRKIIQTYDLAINLGPDTLVCGGTSLLLNSSASGSSNTFLWQDGSTNPTFLASTSG